MNRRKIIIKTKTLLLIVNNLFILFSTFCSVSRSDRLLAIRIVRILERWSTCEGAPGFKRFKLLSLYFTRTLMGVESEYPPFSSKYKRIVKNALIRSSHSNLNAVFWISVFNTHRLVKLPIDFDVTTITNGFKGNKFRLLYNIRSLYESSLSFKVQAKIKPEWKCTWKWHCSGRTGPNGSPAYAHYLEDLSATRKEFVYYKNLLLLNTLPLSNKEETFNSLSHAYIESRSRFDDTSNVIHSRIVGISDKSGKTRLIAIVDILTQSCLSLIHRRMNSVLRKLSTDGTFDQDSQRDRVRKWSEENEFTASIDLTAATDRIPVLYQVFVLIFSDVLTWQQAMAWLFVTTHRSFNISGTSNKVKYSVGQPMGALSSWPAMAISHHVLVQWSYKAAYPNGLPYFFDYSLLGDDLVIKDRLVAGKYLEFIKYLGIDYSPEKSFFSKGRSEFAKSLFRLGKDLTPFPVANLEYKNKTIVNNTLEILKWLDKKNIKTTLSTLTGLFPAGKCRQLATLSALSSSAPKYVLDHQPRADFRVYDSLTWEKSVLYFARIKTFMKSVYYFFQTNPVIARERLSSPHAQLAADNSIDYPVEGIFRGTEAPSDYIILGSEFVSYDTEANPKGLPPLGKELVPLPTWLEDLDDELFSSSLLSTERKFPGYFYTRCSHKQVGDD